MNYEEAARLLATCAAFDSRTIGKADTVAWRTIFRNTPFADAEAAVFDHYGRSGERIMPADVAAGVKRIRRDRVESAHKSFVYTGDPDDTAEYQHQLRAHIRAVGDGRELPPPPALPRAIRPKMLEQVFNGVPRVSLSRWPKSEPPPPRAPISEESLRLAREALAEAARDAERTGRLVGAVKPPEDRP